MCNFYFPDLGFYALPAKEELSPMFPHNSSSHEISTETNAFVQNSMVRVSPVLYINELKGLGYIRVSLVKRFSPSSPSILL